MNSCENKNKLMTTKEVAKVLDVTPRTIRDTVNRLNLGKSISQGMINGKKGYLFNENQVTAIKLELQNHSKINTATPRTMLEKQLLIKQAIMFSDEIITELKKQNEELSLKNEKLQIELDQSKEWYSIKRMQKLNPGYHFNYRLLKNESKRLGFDVGRTFDQNYGKVNTYHQKVWESLYFDTLNFD